MKPLFSVYGRTSREILRDLIWFTSGFALPERDVSFGRPVPTKTRRIDPLRCDMKVVVTIHPTEWGNRCFSGSKLLFYRRIDLGSIRPLRAYEAVPIPGFPFDLWSILPAINRWSGLKLEKEDIDNHVYGQEDVAYLVASHLSLAFCGRVRLNVVAAEVAKPVDPSGSEATDATG
jgi:hypothetical protein